MEVKTEKPERYHTSGHSKRERKKVKKDISKLGTTRSEQR